MVVKFDETKINQGAPKMRWHLSFLAIIKIALSNASVPNKTLVTVFLWQLFLLLFFIEPYYDWARPWECVLWIEEINVN